MPNLNAPGRSEANQSAAPTTYPQRIRAIYPEIPAQTSRPILGHGQNNDILIVDEALLFRFPRYSAGIAALERTTRLLRAIGPRLSRPAPDPLYTCFEPPTVGQVFVGHPLLPGEPLWLKTFEQSGDETIRQQIVDQLANFLVRLHDIPLADVLPDEAAHWDPLTSWANLYERIQRGLFPAMRPDARDGVARHFETFLSAPENRSIRPTLTHGDFGTSNILYDAATAQVTGVIDWDSAGPGDPATDLAAASLYGLDRLARVYPLSEAMRRRVEFYRGTFALQEAVFGLENGDKAAYESGLAGYR